MWGGGGGGGGLYGIDLIYIFTFSNLADTFIQSDLQMRTMEIWFILMQYSHRFSISYDIGYKSACFFFIFYPRAFYIFTFTFMHLADAFIQSDLQCIQDIHFFLSVCVFPGNWTHNLFFALLTQCSTTEPQEHIYILYTFIEGIFPLISLTFISNSYIWSINYIIIMWLLLSIRYQIK